jgi:hypothetical protein
VVLTAIAREAPSTTNRMQVYDLDKTQQWLDRTLAIRREPPMRGGLKPDHKTRRQTAFGVALVALVILLLAMLPVRKQVVAAAAAAPATRLEKASENAPHSVLTPTIAPRAHDSRAPRWELASGSARGGRILGYIPQENRSYRGPTRPHSQMVAPPAPVWLDGK